MKQIKDLDDKFDGAFTELMATVLDQLDAVSDSNPSHYAICDPKSKPIAQSSVLVIREGIPFCNGFVFCLEAEVDLRNDGKGYVVCVQVGKKSFPFRGRLFSDCIFKAHNLFVIEGATL